ncbi:MAG: 30S ribosome-binding factor RbfA [Corynebacterium sp.]|nr:30S ribosome-binding factor RbfA [Corynebacterium sp.]
MADRARAGRMAKRILTIVATALESRIKDPRLKFITVTDVTMTGDLHDATVYYTVRGRTLEEAPDEAGAAEALHRYRGQIRKLVGDELSVRFTPTIRFELDPLPDSRAHMEDLLERARLRDEAIRTAAAGKQFAGDANPYRDTEEPGEE